MPIQVGGASTGGAGVTDGDKGDITVSGSGATWTVDAVRTTDISDAGTTGLAAIQAETAADLQAAADLEEVADTRTFRWGVGVADTPTTGDAKAAFYITSDLDGFVIDAVGAAVYTASSSGLPTFAWRRKRGGSTVDVLSTNVTIDATETTSATATTAAVINTSNDDLATGDWLMADLDVVGTDATGHTAWARATKPLV